MGAHGLHGGGNGGKNLINGHMRGIDDNGVISGAQRGFGAVSVHVVALANLLGQCGKVGGLAHLLQLLKPALGAHFRRGVEENLACGVRENHGAHVAPLHHKGSRAAKALLGQLLEGPHLRQHRHARSHHAHLFRADFLTDTAAIDE
jgi:hypothetical protein